MHAPPRGSRRADCAASRRIRRQTRTAAAEGPRAPARGSGSAASRSRRAGVTNSADELSAASKERGAPDEATARPPFPGSSSTQEWHRLARQRLQHLQQNSLLLP